jgi:hypothetical protein
VAVVVIISSRDNFSYAIAFALNCPLSPWLLRLMSSSGCFAAMVVLFGACPGGCFVAHDVVVGWMLCHYFWYRWMLCYRLLGRMLCCHVATWLDTLPPLVLANALPLFLLLLQMLCRTGRVLRACSL